MRTPPKQDRLFLAVAESVSLLSLDPSTKVGAVIVNKDQHIIGTGYNKFAPDIDGSPENYDDRTFKYAHIIHAEVWATLSVKHKSDLPGSTIYTNFPACPDCVEFLAAHGIKRIVSIPLKKDGKPDWWVDEWKGRLLRSLQAAEKHSIEMEAVKVE